MPDVLSNFTNQFWQIEVKSSFNRTPGLHNISCRSVIYFVRFEPDFAYKIRPCSDFVNSSFYELLTLCFVNWRYLATDPTSPTADDEAFAPITRVTSQPVCIDNNIIIIINKLEGFFFIDNIWLWNIPEHLLKPSKKYLRLQNNKINATIPNHPGWHYSEPTRKFQMIRAMT